MRKHTKGIIKDLGDYEGRHWRDCPYCQRPMTDKERTEYRQCTECYGERMW